MAPLPTDRTALGAAGAAAVLWGTYYLFVLSLPSSENLALILLTPVIGGAITLGAALVIDRPGVAGLRAAILDPRVLAAGLFFLGFQFGAVYSTRIVGAVNTSLLVLGSDVVGTPLLVTAVLRHGGRALRSPGFLVGVVVIAAAGSLTIVAGGSPEPLSWSTLALGVPLFLVSSLFIVTTDSANRRRPILVVLGVGPIVVSGLASLAAIGLVGVPAVVGATDLRSGTTLLALSITNYTLAPVLFFWSARRIALVLPSILQAAIPVVTLAYVGFLGLQPVTAVGLVGVPLAFLGASLAVRAYSAEGGPPARLPMP
ncbi:MAG TPA: hypothetical protein VEY07_03155 [Thermoplasmata archaeon]|nr:hypothetical protein [Thermoplasmata archaeon]